ncbi:glutamine synthetase [candidate division KSB1 bacterium]|nr:glutamine synthetase [candidate division KSB1 bacterium]TDI89236.1 MAG: glutamine synthetase [Caldithrix sp.]TDI95132.1 MAG: glutamine synthetase [Caldithrix sp.]
MPKKDKEYVLKSAKDNNVKFIRLWFTDILGFLKSFAITIKELEVTLDEGAGFDGSSIEGFARIDESDMMAIPDLNTWEILPWRHSEESAVARIFCDIQTPEGEPYDGDPRGVLKRNLKRAEDLGYKFYVGPELEFFYFKSSEGTPEPLDRGGYFDLTPLDLASDFRKKTVEALDALGIDVETSHHEVGPSQHEIDLRYTDALTMADNAMTYRLVVKEVALRNNVYATFMPKPLFGENGSGMHVHMSLFKGDRNAFYDSNDKNHLSDLAKRYIAGLIKHAPEFTLITNQWINSYKRLVPGYEAPIYTTWAVRNRSDMIRIPAYKLGKEKATRIEIRSPDPACNPYLAFSALLAAGLEGIEKNYPIVDAVERNVYNLSEEERQELNIETLPGDLYEAIKAMEKSQVIKKAMGDHVFHSLIENKKLEWADYRAQVTDWEMKNYFPIL